VISASAVPGEKKGVAVPLELSEAEAGGIVRAFGEAAGGPPGPDLTGVKSTVPTFSHPAAFQPEDRSLRRIAGEGDNRIRR